MFILCPNPHQGRPAALVFFAHFTDRRFQLPPKPDAGKSQITVDVSFENGLLLIFGFTFPAPHGFELEFAATRRVEHVAERPQESRQLPKEVINKP